MKKAQVISEILGGNPEDYYGLADAYCLSSSNELIEIVLNSSEDILSKYPSYKDWIILNCWYQSQYLRIHFYDTTYIYCSPYILETRNISSAFFHSFFLLFRYNSSW